jgi:hypothetical protein
MSKCTIFKWVVDRWVRGHGGWVSIYNIFKFITFLYLKIELFFNYFFLIAQIFCLI